MVVVAVEVGKVKQHTEQIIHSRSAPSGFLREEEGAEGVTEEKTEKGGGVLEEETYSCFFVVSEQASIV